MNLSEIKAISIPEGEVVRIEANGVVIWEQAEEATYKNWVPLSINADGSIYNNGLGYKDGYRIRSGGAEGAQGYASCTGFIPLKQGDTLRIYPSFVGGNSHNAINFADAAFANLGQVTDSGSVYGICSGHVADFKATTDGEVSVLHLTTDLAADVAYVRITNLIYYNNEIGQTAVIKSGAEMIVTVNEEIT